LLPPNETPQNPPGALAAILLVRAYSVVWAAEPWTTAAAGAAYVIAFAAGATLPGMLMLLLQFAWTAATAGRGGAGGGGEGLARPLLEGSGGGSVPAARVVSAGGGGGSRRGAAAATAAAASLLLQPGGGCEPLPLRAGRPDLGNLVGSWVAGLRQLPSAAATAAAAEASAPDTTPLQVGCFAMGPSGLLSQVQLLCCDLNAGAAGSKAGGGRSVFMRYVQKTHNL
jgi:hypothetical protein